ncbi:lactococcin 972 family bacteriocin [Bacillus sp. Hm123]|uniref:lactococcin 972 family bacteriocin n=1 Tax=Bacillus sp. Hm123 TaxID=3450745 RepID=UPI003F4226E9
MKKIVSTLAVFACLSVSTVSASDESIEIQDSGGVNLDPILQEESKGLTAIAKAVKIPRDGGGTFYVDYGKNYHTSYYNHPTKTHLASVSNAYQTLRSRWKLKKVLAHKSIKSTPWGNKANWQTK